MKDFTVGDMKLTNIILRFLWALFIGSWLTPIWYFLGFIFTALIISAPLGIWFFERIGYVFSLYENPVQREITFTRSLKGILWFYFVGWWLGFLVVALAEVCLGTICLFPAGWWLINRLDQIVILS
ncbi:MAG: hypothetical protein E3J70_08390 [Candidatus Heimdallarchaeota archaeon]|nr:MAG: hypothetical protein E3J70_08390 [Candidatus Heimdallarchaeota archaeon]